MESTSNKRKETNINSSCLVEFFSRPPSAPKKPSAPVPSIAYENWAGVDIMYYLDGGWRCQSLVCQLASRKVSVRSRMSRAVPCGRREGMFPGRYAEIIGRGERRDVF